QRSTHGARLGDPERADGSGAGAARGGREGAAEALRPSPPPPTCWRGGPGERYRSAGRRRYTIPHRGDLSMIQIHDHGDVRELRLDHPPANALSPELIAAVRTAVDAASGEGARALVLSGSPG